MDKIQYVDEHKSAFIKSIMEKGKVRIQEFPLHEIWWRFSEIGEYLRDLAFLKYTDAGGYCFGTQVSYSSKNKLDIQIDHIKTMAQCSLTILDNLQLLHLDKSMSKSDK